MTILPPLARAFALKPIKSSTCLCPACSDQPAPTYTEAFRAATEARYVASLPSNERRAAYLEGVAKHRGEEAAMRLR